VSRLVHGGTVYLQDDETSVPPANIAGGLNVWGEVDVLPVSLARPLVTDVGHEFLGGAMVEDFGWVCGGEAEVNGDGVALVGADTGTIDGEALFIIIGNNTFDIGFGAGTAVFVGGSDQIVDIHPAPFIQGQTDRLWTVAEDEAEESAETGVVHVCSVNFLVCAW
jgi:hypothetical protein